MRGPVLRVRSPLLTESPLMCSLCSATEMFHFAEVVVAEVSVHLPNQGEFSPWTETDLRCPSPFPFVGFTSTLSS